MGNPVIEALHKALTNDPHHRVDEGEMAEIRDKVEPASYIELSEARQWLRETCPKIIMEEARCFALNTLLTVSNLKQKSPKRVNTHEEISLGGHLPSGVIQRTLFQNYPRLGDVFRKQLGPSPNLKGGRILIEFKIGSGGNVKSVQLTPDRELAIPKMLDEMTTIILSIKFPKPLGGGDINVSHLFVIRALP